MLSNRLIRAYFLWLALGSAPLDSHERWSEHFPVDSHGRSTTWVGSRFVGWLGFMIENHSELKVHELTLPETNISPENGWLEYDRFLLGFGPFSGANC